MIIFLVLRLLDLLTTYIGINLGVNEGNALQALLMTLGPIFYLLNMGISLAFFYLMGKYRHGKLVLSLFMGMNVVVILSNLLCIGLALSIKL